MPNCSYGDLVEEGADVHFVYTSDTCEQASTVCGGWVVHGRPALPRPSAPPSVDNADPDAVCVGVPPGKTWTSAPSAAPAGAFAYLVRVDFDRAEDAGTLAVYADGQEITSGPVGPCPDGVAMWTFDVN